MKQIGPLRDETQKRGMALAAASKRHAAPQEACKLLQQFVKAESRFVSYVVAKQTACQIPPEIPTQLKTSHAKAEEMEKKVCAAASAPQGPAGPTLSDVIGSPSLPDPTQTKRSGGNTFDTLSGNVLTR